MADTHINNLAVSFVDEVKQTPEYGEYFMQLEKIKRQPELYERVNEFRQKNYVLQNTEEAENLMDRMDELEQEYEELREIPLVEDFLEAETSFCRMMQEVNLLVIKELNFQ